jgi:hypothetical protein
MARRLSARSMRALERRGSKRKAGDKPWSQVSENIRNRINNAARQAAAAVMNDLAEKGPAYSGEFRDKWRAIAITGGLGQTTPSGYPYSTRDIPRLDTKVRTLEKVKVFEIVNTSPYALYAMDIIPGIWRKPEGSEPIGGIEFGVKRGRREYGETFRGDVDLGQEGKGSTTAEKDWYENYVRGGGLSAGVKRAVKFAIRSGGDGNVRIS